MEILKLKGYKIIPCGEHHATHTVYKEIPAFDKLTEDLCKKMCKEYNRGVQYSYKYRYTYVTPYFNNKEHHPMAALFCVQRTIKEYYGSGITFIKIIKK